MTHNLLTSQLCPALWHLLVRNDTKDCLRWSNHVTWMSENTTSEAIVDCGWHSFDWKSSFPDEILLATINLCFKHNQIFLSDISWHIANYNKPHNNKVNQKGLQDGLKTMTVQRQIWFFKSLFSDWKWMMQNLKKITNRDPYLMLK